MIRKRYLLLLTTIFAGGCFIFAANSAIDITVFGIKPEFRQLQSNQPKTKHRAPATINTEGCTIPALEPLDESIKEFVEYPTDLPQCANASLALLGKNSTTIWIKTDAEILNFYNISEGNTVTCCYRSFYRPESIKDITSKHVDNRVEYEDCVEFNETIEVKHEFVRVNCSVDTKQIYEQFYPFVPVKKFTKHGDKDEIKNKTGYNVLIVGVDTVSRLNLLRTMPNTALYLKKKGAIEMLGYNKVGLNTFPNLIPMLIGVKETELSKLCYPHPKATFDNCPFIWEKFRQAGYYTAYVEDATSYSTFNYLKSGFGNTPTDYYLRTFLREAESRKNSIKYCMNDIYFYKVMLDYIEDITRSLKSRRLFGLFWETGMSHDHLNWPMRMDDDYVRMFENLESAGTLNDTIIFFVSDHGIRWGSIRYTKQGRLEESLPFLYVLTPPSFQKEYPKAFKNLRLNSERLTTPYDLHETLSDLVNLTNVNDSAISTRSSESYASKRSISLFLSIPTNRTCHAADIDNQWCTCRKEVPLKTDDPKVIQAANILVVMINYLLTKFPQCMMLNLSKIVNAIEIQVGEVEEDEDSWTEYLLTIQTGPSGAMFEGVLRHTLKDQNWHWESAPSRVNRYDDQSRCIDDYKMKSYCYCR